MTRVQTVFCVLVCIQCFLCQGFTNNIIEIPEGYSVDETFANDVIDWKCESDSDCIVVSSSCNNGTCQCPTGYIYDGSMTLCIKVATTYGDVCEESIQCSRYLYHGGTCMNSICVCAEGYYYMHGRCNAYSGLFGKCRKDDDCYVNGDLVATSCINGTCKCSSGYYQREYRSCRPEAKGVGEKCMIDNDCRFNSVAYCDIDNTCALPGKGVRMSKSSSDDNILQDIFVSQIGDNTTTSNCAVDEDCKHLGNAFCEPSRTCACKRAHFFVEKVGKCIPELGESCQSSDTVVIEYSECLNGKWNCEIQRVASRDNRKCEKAINRYENYCNTDTQCYIFGPDAICEDHKCVCNENSWFNNIELFCWIKKGIDEECQQDIDCHTNDSTVKLSCTENVCSCPNGSHSNSNKTACVENKAGIGKRCEVNTDCVTENAECVNEICTCKTNYYELNDHCVSGINSTCTSSEDCEPENSECVSEYCACKEEYVATSVSSCKPASSFGGPCEENIQCSSKVPNSICLTRNDSTKDSICSCPEGQHYKLGECFKRKVLGMECDNLGECYLSSNENRVLCKNGLCSCDWNYIEVNKTVCGARDRFIYINNSSITKVPTWLLTMLLLLISCLVKLDY